MTSRRLHRLGGLLVAGSLLLLLPPATSCDAAAQHPDDAYARAGSPGPTPAPVSGLPSVPGDTLEALAAEVTRAVVLLDVETGSGSRQGSGFIVEDGGRIFTNYHVIEGARRIHVKLASGDVYQRVKIMATDERRDIAVLEIPAYGLPTIPLGNSNSVGVGTSVIAVGSPLGLENTVSTGIVSGRRQEADGYQLLQISAPASQGSSGGPVITQAGDVIGIAVSQIQDGQNLNFAVPINYARGLLAHLEDEPVAVLSPDSPARGAQISAMASDPSRVNRGLTFDLEGFHGYSVEMEGRVEENRQWRSRVTYRRIETVGAAPTIERYVESETTERTGPFGTPQTVRREKARAIVAADDLRPISVRGEVGWWNGEDWRRSEYSLRFEGYHVTGTITDSAGNVREISQDLPPGTVLRSTRHLAFATLAEDSLLNRSVELVTFDAGTGEMTSDRYDVLAPATARVDGREHPALRVNLVSGLSHSTALFRRSVPRVLLRRETGYGDETAEITSLQLFGADEGPTEPDSAEYRDGGRQPD